MSLTKSGTKTKKSNILLGIFCAFPPSCLYLTWINIQVFWPRIDCVAFRASVPPMNKMNAEFIYWNWKLTWNLCLFFYMLCLSVPRQVFVHWGHTIFFFPPFFFLPPSLSIKFWTLTEFWPLKFTAVILEFVPQYLAVPGRRTMKTRDQFDQKEQRVVSWYNCYDIKILK